MKKLQAPLVHMNGSSDKVLIEQLRECSHLLYKTLGAFEKASPNQRDYYPLGEEAWKRARDQYAVRVSSLRNIKREIDLIAQLIVDKEIEAEIEE